LRFFTKEVSAVLRHCGAAFFVNYLLLSRAVYSAPFILYLAYYVMHVDGGVLDNMTFLLAAFFWGVAFLFSLVLFHMSKRVQPLMLLHFLFIIDFSAFAVMASTTMNPVFFLFVLPSSFATVEAMRNQVIGILLHFLVFGGSLFFLWSRSLTGILGLDYASSETLWVFCVVLFCIVCRGILSALDDKTVLTVSEKEDSEAEGKKEYDFGEEYDKNLEELQQANEKIQSLQEENAKLKELAVSLRKEIGEPVQDDNLLQDPTKRLNDKYQRMIENIAGYYSSFIKTLHHSANLKKSDEIKDVMKNLAAASGAGYVGLFTIKKDELRLANSSNRMNIDDMGSFLQSKDVLDGIRHASVSEENISQEYEDGMSSKFINIREILYVPYKISGRTSIIMMCFSKIDKNMVPHYCNLAMLASKHIAELY